MPKRKSPRVAKTQPSLENIPPPEMRLAQKPMSSVPAKPTTDGKRVSDLFIVDNSEEEWKVARYLRDWCEIAKAFDIATGYFEIGALLALQKMCGTST